MPTIKQDQSFSEEMQTCVDSVKMSNTTLDNAIEWMQNYLSPDDVFTEKQLKAWAENNGYTENN